MGQAALESLVAYPAGKRARSRALKLAGSVRSTAHPLPLLLVPGRD